MKKTSLFYILFIWLIGWSIFALIEISMRLITTTLAGAYIETFPLMAFICLIFYILFGMLTGFILHGITKLLSHRGVIRLNQLRLDCFHIALCVAIMVFVHASLFIHDKFLSDVTNFINLFSNIGLLCVCFTVFLVTYKAFLSIREKSKVLITYPPLVLALNMFLEFALYRDPLLIPENIRTTHLMDYTLLLAVCIVGYLLTYSLSLLIIKSIKRNYSAKFLSATTFLLIIAVIGTVLILNNRKKSSPSSSNHELSTSDNKTNVILIVMDTTRRDHLSCYGYERKTTPNIDILSRESLLCTNAYSPSSWTLPSHSSIMTGLYPLQHGAHFNVNSSENSLSYLPFSINTLPDSFNTLAEILSEHGYNTAGVVAATFCHRFFGIAQGFDYYHDSFQKVTHDLKHYIIYRIASRYISLEKFFARYGYDNVKRASKLNKLVFSWLEKNYSEPFFLFINYFDPHAIYGPPAPYDRLYNGKEYLQHIIENHGDFWNIYSAVMKNNHKLTAEELAFFFSQYDGEIAYLDYHIGKLMAKLKSLKIYDNSMIIITADHGEMFGEHYLLDHSKTLYEELTHIPLIIKYPSSIKITGTFESPVSLIDIMPTVLSTLGIPLPDNIQGKTIPEIQAGRKLFAELFRSNRWIELISSKFDRDLLVIYSGDYKYIRASNGKNELYNLKKDPKESNNLVHEMPEIAAKMESDLQDRIALQESSKAINVSPQASNSIKDKLRSLGYIQ